MTAGALARWILWDKETLHEGVAEYLRRLPHHHAQKRYARVTFFGSHPHLPFSW